jgi:MFS family permease
MNERSFLYYSYGQFLSSGKIRFMLSPIEAFIQKNLRFNFILGLFDGGFFGFGMGFASFTAIIPLFVHHLTNSALLIGLVPAIHNMGWQLPQLFTAGWLARARTFKPLALWFTINERVPYLGLAIVSLFVPLFSKPVILALTFLMLIWQGFGAGFTANPWTNLVTRVIPQDIHGTFFGTQAAALNLFAGISAILAGIILDKIIEPLNFSLCFLLAFFFMAISFVILSFTREHESNPKQRESQNALWGKSLTILRSDSNFRAYLGVRIISQFAGMAFGFYVIYAVLKFKMSDSAAGIMVAILLIGQVILSPLMGYLGDRWSHRGVMIAGAIGAALSAILAWKATSANWFFIIFLLESVAIVAIWTIPIALGVSFAKNEEERPIYIGLANTIPAPAAILAPILGGWIADTRGFDLTFILSTLCALLMTASLWFFVKDPTSK